LKYGQSAAANLGDLTNFSLINILFIISFFFVILNIGLAIFNLFPIPPLDGSKILSGVLPTETYFRIMKYEKYVGIVFLLLVILFPQAISSVLTPITGFFTTLFSDILSPLIKLFV
jgi:Zn-dependent protease